MIKLIPKYNGAYGCDEKGNIYSYYIQGGCEKIGTTPQLMTQYCGSNNNYKLVKLSFNGETHNALVHRLVASTWIDNPNHYEVVNHIDHNVFNNCKDNLEWCAQQENVNKSIKDFSSLNGMKTKTRLYSPSNELLGEFESLSLACDYCKQHYGISTSSLKKYKKSHGFYIEVDENSNLAKHSEQLKKKWILYNPDSVELGEFDTVADAGRYIKENIRDISIKLFTSQKKSYGYYVKEKCRD